MTKADAVDTETLELAVEEARELVPEAQVLAVSAKTGASAIRTQIAVSDLRRSESRTRLVLKGLSFIFARLRHLHSCPFPLSFFRYLPYRFE